MSQIDMFGSRDSSRVAGGSVPIFWSTTWMLRAAFMADFKVRAACPMKTFRQRTVSRRTDAEGNRLVWVASNEKGQWVHVRGPDGKPLIRKIKPNEPHPWYVEDYDPPHPEFPSHVFPTSSRDYSVVGDDGVKWDIGSRGNDLVVLRQEVACNPFLWPEEKTEVLTWLAGDRKIDPEDETLIKMVDGYYCQRIRNGPQPTEAEIEASGLPDYIVENLVYNLRNCG